MPQFRSREEYEKWKARRMQGPQERRGIEEDNSRPGPKGSPVDETELPPPEPPSRPRRAGRSGGLSGIGELFRRSWAIYKARLGVLLPLCFLSIVLFSAALGIFLGIGFALSLVVGSLAGAFIALGALLGSVAGTIVLFWTLAAFILAIVDNRLGIKGALAEGWERKWSFVWLFSLSGFIIAGGFMLLFIPGLIFMVWFAFSQFIVASEDDRGMYALLKSKEYVRERWVEVFVRLFAVWLVSVLLGLIPFIGPILSLLFAPLMLVYLYLIYQELRAIKGEVLYSVSTGEKAKWIGAGALGYVAGPVLIIFFLGASLTVPLMILKGMMDAKVQGVSFSSPRVSPHQPQVPQPEIVPGAGPPASPRIEPEGKATP